MKKLNVVQWKTSINVSIGNMSKALDYVYYEKLFPELTNQFLICHINRNVIRRQYGFTNYKLDSFVDIIY